MLAQSLWWATSLLTFSLAPLTSARYTVVHIPMNIISSETTIILDHIGDINLVGALVM